MKISRVHMRVYSCVVLVVIVVYLVYQAKMNSAAGMTIWGVALQCAMDFVSCILSLIFVGLLCKAAIIINPWCREKFLCWFRDIASPKVG